MIGVTESRTLKDREGRKNIFMTTIVNFNSIDFEEILNKIKFSKISLNIYVLIPISNQGSGKSYFYENVIKPFFETQPKAILKLLSSDVVNLKLIEKYTEDFPGVERTKAYEETRRGYKVAYQQELRSIFSEIYHEAMNSSGDLSNVPIFVLYIDKNHPLNEQTQNYFQRKIYEVSENKNLKFISVDLISKEIIQDKPLLFRDLKCIEK